MLSALCSTWFIANTLAGGFRQANSQLGSVWIPDAQHCSPATWGTLCAVASWSSPHGPVDPGSWCPSAGGLVPAVSVCYKVLHLGSMISGVCCHGWGVWELALGAVTLPQC